MTGPGPVHPAVAGMGLGAPLTATVLTRGRRPGSPPPGSAEDARLITAALTRFCADTARFLAQARDTPCNSTPAARDVLAEAEGFFRSAAAFFTPGGGQPAAASTDPVHLAQFCGSAAAALRCTLTADADADSPVGSLAARPDDLADIAMHITEAADDLNQATTVIADSISDRTAACHLHASWVLTEAGRQETGTAALLLTGLTRHEDDTGPELPPTSEKIEEHHDQEEARYRFRRELPARTEIEQDLYRIFARPPGQPSPTQPDPGSTGQPGAPQEPGPVTGRAAPAARAGKQPRGRQL